MFERYTESARRVIFFARYEASSLGSTTIETEHLLLGLLREHKSAIERVAAKMRADQLERRWQNSFLRSGDLRTLAAATQAFDRFRSVVRRSDRIPRIQEII